MVHQSLASRNIDASNRGLGRAATVKQFDQSLVIDNASIHTSRAVNDKWDEWKEAGLNLFFLPTYSPELNLIEILWRKIKQARQCAPHDRFLDVLIQKSIRRAGESKAALVRPASTSTTHKTLLR